VVNDGVVLLEGEVRALIADAVADFDERAMLGRVPRLADLGEASKALHDAVVGFGPLQRYLDDPQVEEICINESARDD
jgi:pilus assembly protein CpaF